MAGERRPGGKLKPAELASNSQLFPLLSTGRQLIEKAFLLPVALTAVTAVALFSATGAPELYSGILAVYLAWLGYYVVYRLCGKRKAWWVLLLPPLATFAVMVSPLFGLLAWFFRGVLPGDVASATPTSFWSQFVAHFFGAGLLEELVKALPVFAMLLIGRQRTTLRDKLGIIEPLDGILLGAAAGAGFTLVETLGQYVPALAQTGTSEYGHEAVGYLLGLHILIPRMMNTLFGHMAYAGYFGYFIGLAQLRPAQRWRTLAIGYFTAAATHAMWNASSTLGRGASIFAAIIAYALLAAAILKARLISPNRGDNFASRVVQPKPVSPASVPPPVVVPPVVPRGGGVPAAISTLVRPAEAGQAAHGLPEAAYVLRLGPSSLALTAGTLLRAQNIGSLRPQGVDGAVAAVNAKPGDAEVIGIKNLSDTPWNVTMTDGTPRAVEPGKVLRLADGLLIDFGGGSLGIVTRG